VRGGVVEQHPSGLGRHGRVHHRADGVDLAEPVPRPAPFAPPAAQELRPHRVIELADEQVAALLRELACAIAAVCRAPP
jgi:hypothetical protein